VWPALVSNGTSRHPSLIFFHVSFRLGKVDPKMWDVENRWPPRRTKMIFLVRDPYESLLSTLLVPPFRLMKFKELWKALHPRLPSATSRSTITSSYCVLKYDITLVFHVIPPEMNGVWMACIRGSSHTSPRLVVVGLGQTKWQNLSANGSEAKQPTLRIIGLFDGGTWTCMTQGCRFSK